MKILITETQLKKLRKFLTEISIRDAYNKFYKDIPEDVFNQIIKADPLSKPNFLSPYAKWLLNIYRKKNLRLEDLEAATEYINAYERYKNNYRNIDFNKLNTLGDLYSVIKNDLAYSQAKTGTVNLCQPIEGAKKVYEDNNWCVIIPKTEYTACYYGRNTEWCTAWGEMSFDDRHKGKTNRFQYHDEQGEIFININKNDQDEKYQFHFESNQFMDVDDNEINVWEFFEKNSSLKNFYNNILKDKVKNIKFNDLIINDNGCFLFVKDWSEFSDAFEDDRNHRNPALFLNELQDDYWDYDYDKSDVESYFDEINQSNLKFMIDLLIKNGDITQESDDDDIKQTILDDDELFSAIEKSLSWTIESADKDAAYNSIVGEIIDFFGITDIKYENNGILLKMNKCPEPILLYTIDRVMFIDGYSDLMGRIDYNYPYYGFSGQGNPNWKQFNEYLSDELGSF